MKYALFVLGMILIVVGGYFLFSGSNIIEVERGWASVISGTTALTGGVITLGLAGVVKSLEDLQRLWAAGLERPVIGAAAAPVPVAPAEPSPAFDFNPTHVEADAISPFEAAVPPDEPTLPPAPDIIPNPLPSAPIQNRPRLTPQFDRSEEKPAPTPDIAGLRQRVADDFSLNWPSFNQRAEPAAEPPALPEFDPAEVTPPPLHLDDLDIDEPELPIHEPEPATHEPEAHAEPGLPLSTKPEPAIPEAEDLSDTEAPKPKAIGRYEADGTLYVMFADGSIEAQSADGTRRFKSMADLKASFHA